MRVSVQLVAFRCAVHLKSLYIDEPRQATRLDVTWLDVTYVWSSWTTTRDKQEVCKAGWHTDD